MDQTQPLSPLPTILDLTLEELSSVVTPAFRAKQVYHWIYNKMIDDFSQMGNMPKTLREELAGKYTLKPMEVVRKEESADGSVKYLFRLRDGHTVETVLLLMKEGETDDEGTILSEPRHTVCLSTQVGCKVGCSFCLTAKGGFVRNLTPGEIVGQLLLIRKDQEIPARRRTNIVYMGMGEPLDNLENVSKAIRIFAEESGMGISPRRQTISTSGISSKIDKLGNLDLGVLLAISLHAVDDETREELIPMNKAFPIRSIIDAVKRFPIDARKRVMFEYLVIKDLNDKPEHARKLVKLLDGIKAKVNLIYFNPHEGSRYGRPSDASMESFRELLLSKGVNCTIRASRGLDISAACGQLREKDVSCETL